MTERWETCEACGVLVERACMVELPNGREPAWLVCAECAGEEVERVTWGERDPAALLHALSSWDGRKRP